MAEEASTQEGGIAVMERLEVAPPARSEKKRKADKKQKDEPIEHEIEFSTPFGKLEFEFEPTDAKQKREERKREKQQADRERALAKAERKEAKRREKGDAAIVGAVAARKGSALVPVLIVFGLLVAVVAVAFWLFGRPADEIDDAVPDQFRNPELEPAAEGPQGFAAKAQQRIRHAVRAGKKASRDAQVEQEKRFQDLTSGG